MSENFIIEFKDKVNWIGISYNQELSGNFIREFQDKIIWRGLIYNSNINEKIAPPFILGNYI